MRQSCSKSAVAALLLFAGRITPCCKLALATALFFLRLNTLSTTEFRFNRNNLSRLYILFHISSLNRYYLLYTINIYLSFLVGFYTKISVLSRLVLKL